MPGPHPKCSKTVKGISNHLSAPDLRCRSMTYHLSAPDLHRRSMTYLPAKRQQASHRPSTKQNRNKQQRAPQTIAQGVDPNPEHSKQRRGPQSKAQELGKNPNLSKQPAPCRPPHPLPKVTLHPLPPQRLLPHFAYRPPCSLPLGSNCPKTCTPERLHS